MSEMGHGVRHFVSTFIERLYKRCFVLHRNKKKKNGNSNSNALAGFDRASFDAFTALFFRECVDSLSRRTAPNLSTFFIHRARDHM